MRRKWGQLGKRRPIRQEGANWANVGRIRARREAGRLLERRAVDVPGGHSAGRGAQARGETTKLPRALCEVIGGAGFGSGFRSASGLRIPDSAKAQGCGQMSGLREPNGGGFRSA
eukprot:2191905-Prymnesium_polylepis.1